jgi:hypothetical protein
MQGHDIESRILRVSIFVLLSLIILRYLTGISLSDVDQMKIVLGSAVCYMFVNTYYPDVIIPGNNVTSDK